eukprot:g6223.t1
MTQFADRQIMRISALLVGSVLVAVATAEGVFDVLDFGAEGDGETLDGPAITAAFAACRRAGGGEVLFRAGHRFLTGPVVLGCNDSVVRVEPGATVLSVNTTRDWPLGPDCPEPAQGKTSRQAQPFVMLDRARNVSVVGGGEFDARGAMWWDAHCGNWWCPKWVRKSEQPYAWRPYTFRIKESSHIRIDNVTFTNPGFWCVVPTHSDNVVITNLRVVAPAFSPNTDGVEPMWSSNVLVRGAHITNGDDCITVKSGSSNVTVEDVVCENSHGITIGSVWYDDVVNVTYRNVSLRNCKAGARIKGRSQGNATVRDVRWEGISMEGSGTGVEVDMTYETPGSVSNNTGVTVIGAQFDGVRGTVAEQAAKLVCLEARPCAALHAQNVSLTAAAGSKAKIEWSCQHAALDASSASAGVSPPPPASCVAAGPTPPPTPPPTSLPPLAGCHAALYNATGTTGNTDLAMSKEASLAGCCAACAARAGCGAFTFMPVPDGKHRKGDVNCWQHAAGGIALESQRDRVAGLMLE